MLLALERMLAMRACARRPCTASWTASCWPGRLDDATVQDMYRIMAIADYEDRFVVPSSHKEMVEDSFNEKGSCGFTFGNGCSGGVSEGSLFGKKPLGSEIFIDMPKSRKKAAAA